METNADLVFLRAGSSRLSTWVGYSGPIYCRLEWRGGDAGKCTASPAWWFHDGLLCCRWEIIQFLQRPRNNLLKWQIIIAHLYRSSCAWSFWRWFQNWCVSDLMWTTIIPREIQAKYHTANYTLCYTCQAIEEGRDERENKVWAQQRGRRMRLLW